MNLPRIKSFSISTLLLTILVAQGDAFNLRDMLEELLRRENLTEQDIPNPKSRYVEPLPKLRYWKDYEDLYEDSDEFHSPIDDYYSPRDDYHSSKEMFHSSKKETSDSSTDKMSVVFNNIFVMPSHDDNREDHELHPQKKPNIQDNSFNSSICSDPTNWAACARYISETGLKGNNISDSEGPSLLRAMLYLLGNGSFVNSKNLPRAPATAPSSVKQKSAAKETISNIQRTTDVSRNATKLEKPTGRILNSRNSSISNPVVKEVKTPLRTVDQKLQGAKKNATYIPRSSYVGWNNTSIKPSPSNVENATVRWSQDDNDDRDEID